MKVYSVSQNQYYNYPIKQNHIHIYKNIGHENIVYSKNNKKVNFTGYHFNYKAGLIKYIKIKSLQKSMKTSSRPYLSLNKNLSNITEQVKIPVNRFEYINAFDINPQNSDRYVIFLHGFSQNITSNQPLYEALSKTNYGVLAIDYRGYGKNKKTINFKENNMAEDIVAAKKYLKQKGITQIGLIGHSFGAYLSTKVSKTDYFDFQILVSPMLSLQFWFENVIKHPKKYKKENFMIKYIPQFGEQYHKVFRMQKHVYQNPTPTYIIHSKTDRYIHYQDVDNFAQKLNKFKLYTLLNEGGHKMDEHKIESIVNTLGILSEK